MALINHAFVAVRISMALEGVGVDPEGRALVESSLDPTRAAAAPPDCLILNPEGQIVARFRSGSAPQETLAVLSAALEAHPDLEQAPTGRAPHDPVYAAYAAGLERYHAGFTHEARPHRVVQFREGITHE